MSKWVDGCALRVQGLHEGCSGHPMQWKRQMCKRYPTYQGNECGLTKAQVDGFNANVGSYCLHFCNPCFTQGDAQTYSKCQNSCRNKCVADTKTKALFDASPCRRSAAEIPACDDKCYAQRCA